MSRKTATVAGMFVSLASLASLGDSALGMTTQGGAGGSPSTSVIPQLRACRVETLTLPNVPIEASKDEIPETFETTVTLGDETVRLRLHRHSLRAPDATLLVDIGNNTLVPQPLPPARTYRGEVIGEPGSGVAASLVNGGFVATIERPTPDHGVDRWHVEPLSNLILPAGVGDATSLGGAHVSYRGDDVLASGGTCGVDTMHFQGLVRRPPAGNGAGSNPDHDHDHDQGQSQGHDHQPGGASGTGDQDHDAHGTTTGGGESGAGDGGEGGIAGTNKYLAEIAFDADFEFYQKNSNSLTITVNDIETVMNQVEFIYDRDVDINYEFTTFVVRTTSTDPYTSTNSDDLLCEFRTTWNASPELSIQREVAHLFTGKALDGSTIGVAWLGVVCNEPGTDCGAFANLAYSLVESKFSGATLNQRIALSCHELGHNWGAAHCDGQGDCHIMCSGLGGCDGIAGSNLKFGVPEVADIVAYRNSATCDLVVPATLTLPFSETWSSASIPTAKWIYLNGASVSSSATNEPSSPNSLNLDTTGSTLYEDDEIRSHFIALSGVTQVVTFSYWTQHKGVDSGETLTVDYLNSSEDWITLNTIVSNGVDETNFTQWSHVLPSDAKHNEFRVRFRVDGNEFTDDWYIDDIKVEVTPPPANDDCSGATVIGTGTTAWSNVGATTSTPAAPTACNDGNGTTLVNDIWFRHTASCTGTLTATTCGLTTLNTRLLVYPGTACPTSTLTVACDDDTAGCANGTSTVNFPVTAGVTYYIRLGVISGFGTGSLTVSCQPSCPDSDGDGICNTVDNCPSTPNASQADADGDNVGDACDGCPNDPNKTAPGACGCGVPDTDSDGDGTPNCADGCPNDPAKIAPGTCGCGTADTDSDGDGTPNCNDGCPNDPAKTAPGTCGCGTADTDSDGDGTPNCADGCPNDPAKTSPGTCGCGVADTDSDGDGVANCNDGCPNDPAKTSPGTCGCGIADTDSDGDGTPNCNDGCPNDPAKTSPGACGCGIADTDSDGDGTPNCNDGCPSDPAKTSPGACGCGTADTDSDGDGAADCIDGCPNDPAKTSAGACGCGVADTDADGDGTADCNDGCPNDPAKTDPGACGCGVADTDTDGDGTVDCADGCPTDPLKTAPGACGCGVADADSDRDGVADCLDGCPTDPLKAAPGACGCGVPDEDLNENGIPDCNEAPCETSVDADPAGQTVTACEPVGFTVLASGEEPLTYQWRKNGEALVDDDRIQGSTSATLLIDPVLRADAGLYDVLVTSACGSKALSGTAELVVEPAGNCSCVKIETDSDGDGVSDCDDGCPNDPAKTVPGVCGCGVADLDSDGDGTADCIDGCASDPSKTEPGACGCGVPEVDSDGDTVLDCDDVCPGFDDLVDTDNDGIPDGCDVPECPVDLNGDLVIDGGDLAIILGSWGSCAACEADLDNDGVVGGSDLALVLGSWGACP